MTFQERYSFNPQTDLIGSGGFARVFRAYDNLLRRQVALKFYKGEEGGNYDVVSEIRYVIGKQLHHDNLVAYYDVALVPTVNNWGDTTTLQIGIIEYINGHDYLKSGVDLNAFLTDQNPNEDTLKKTIRDVLNGLLYLEQNSVIHRDLKPANILMHRLENGVWRAKIGDFGLSKNTDSNSTIEGIKGTIEYMSPEQFFPDKYGIGGKIGTNSDLWAFGAILYEIFTKQVPYGRRSNGSSLAQMISSATNFDSSSLQLHGIPQTYREIIKLCLVQNANQRVRSANTLLEILDGKLIRNPSYPDSTVDTPLKPNSTSTTNAFLDINTWVGLAALALIIGGIWYAYSGDKETETVVEPETIAETNQQNPPPTEQPDYVVPDNYAEDIKITVDHYYNTYNGHDANEVLNYFADNVEQYYGLKNPTHSQIRESMVNYPCYPTSQSTFYRQTIESKPTNYGFLTTYTIDSNCNPDGEQGARYGNRNIRIYVESKLDRNYKIISIRETNREAEPITVSKPNGSDEDANRRVQQNSNAGNNAMRFEEMTYNFGTMNQDDKGKHDFVFTNRSNQPMYVESAVGSNPCVGASSPTKAIQPNERATVIVYFNSKKCTGSQTQTITIANSINRNPVVLTIYAQVIASE